MLVTKSGLISLKGSPVKLSNETKSKDKKFIIAHVNVGGGMLWYYPKDVDPSSGAPPTDIIYLHHAEVTEKDSKVKEHGFEFVLNLKTDKKWHITFAADSEEDKLSWMEAINENIDLTSAKLFETTIKDAALKTNRCLPTFISNMFNLIEPHAAQEGIFRLSGNATKIAELKDQLSRGEVVDLTSVDVHTITGLLKGYFRELRSPLIPFSFYSKFLSLASFDGNELVAKLKEAVAELPDTNRLVLSCLMRFLKRVSMHSATSKMNTENLAIVFGPTILRPKPSSKATKDELSSTAAINKVCEALISHSGSIFQDSDDTLAAEPARGGLPVVQDVLYPKATAEERALIETTLTAHFETWENVFVIRVFKKAKTLDEAILVIGQNRIYLFSKGKLDADVHYMDITELSSPSSSELKIVYGASKPQELVVRPVSFASFDIDMAIVRIIQQNDENTLGTPAELKFKVNIEPSERATEIRNQVTPPDEHKGCGGFVRAFAAVCDYYNIPLPEEICWDLDNLFYLNEVKTFNVSEFVHKDKYPNDEFKALMAALQHNTWFTELICDGQKLGAEATLVANVFKTNKCIKTLRLVNVGLTNTAADNLAQAFKQNPPSLEEFNISGNQLDEKALISLASAIEKFQSLSILNISGCNVGKKGVVALLDALQKNAQVCATLQEVDISGNSLNDQEASRKLGLLLGKATSLRSLNVANTQAQWQFVCVCFEKSQSITRINISELKVAAKQADDIVLFLKQLPLLDRLVMRNVNISMQNLLDILAQHPSLIKLDISDNEFSDDDLIAFADYFEAQDKSLALEELDMSRMFGRRTKNRAQAIDALARILELRPIRRLKIQGGTKSRLQQDILPLIFSLSNNKTLEELDISGHQAGDALAFALGKVLQHNKTLQTLFWDDNLTTMAGLKMFKIGLGRNYSLRYMPLPVLDMANILKTEPDLNAVVQISTAIQQHVFENAAAAYPASSANTPKPGHGSQPSPGTTAVKPKRTSSKAERPTKRRNTTATHEFKPVDVSRASKLFGQATLRSGLIANIGVVPVDAMPSTQNK